MSEHSQEPWAMTADWDIEDATEEVVVLGLIDADFFFQNEERATEANIRRIVACVNACKGFHTKDLEILLRHDGTLEQSIDLSPRCMAVIKSAVDEYEEMEDAAGLYDLIAEIDNALEDDHD